MSSKRINRAILMAAVAVVGGAVPRFAQAATYTWSGGGANSNWNTGLNWVGDVAPPDNNATDLRYTGTAAQLTSTNTANDFNIRNLSFTADAASYTIVANNSALLFTKGIISQDSSSAQLFSYAGSGSFKLDQGASTLTGAGTGTVTFGTSPGSGTINTRSSSGTNTFVLDNRNFSVVINSDMAGSGAGKLGLSKGNLGTATLTGNNTFTGGTAVTGGKLVLDYNTIATGDRLANTGAVNLNGGELVVLGDSAGATVETVGVLTPAGGTLTLKPGTGQSVVFTAASASIPATGSMVVRGDGLGLATGTFSQLKFTSVPTLVGGGGAAGTSQVSILPWLLGGTSSTGTATGLTTYDVNGVRLLDESTEYADYGSAVANDNAKITTGGAVNGRTDINALLLKNISGSGMTVTLNDGTNLAPVSGTFLFSGNASSPITLTKDTAGAGDATISMAANTSARMYVTANTTATVNAPIQLNTTGALVKDGAGTLVMNQALAVTNFASGTLPVIAINGGTLKAGAANIVATPNVAGNDYVTAMTIAGGAMFDLNGFDQAFVTKGRLSTSFGSIVTNTGANATLTPNGPSNSNGGALSSGKSVILDGTFTDGTPGDFAATGLVSLNFTSSSSNNGNNLLAISHGGQTFNDFTARATNSDKATARLYSLTPTDDNTIYGTTTLNTHSGNGNGFVTLEAYAVSNGTTVSKTLGNAPIIFTTDSNGTSSASVLNVRLSGETGVLDGTTSTWTNDITLTAFSSSNSGTAKITLDRGDGLSANFTHQLGNLLLTGTTRKLDVTASNGTTLQFTGTTTLNHSAATTDTFTVSAGKLKLADIGQSGTGNKSLSKTGAGVLEISSGATVSYLGTTSVTGGTLLMNGTSSGQDNWTVNATATLGGSGTVGLASGKSLTVGGATAGTLAPGNLIGTLSVAGNVTFGDLSTYAVEVGSGTSADQLAITGDLNLASASDTLSLVSLAGAFGGSNYTIATFTGSLTDKFSTVLLDNVDITATAETSGFTVGPNTYKLKYNANDIALVIPEPGTIAGLGMLLGGLILGRRRRA